MSKLINTVFGDRYLALYICKFLSYKEILSLNIKYKDLIYIIYYELYMELKHIFNISTEEIKLLSQKTNELLREKYYALEDIYNDDKFAPKEEIIRDIIFKYTTDNIFSIYCILYNTGLYKLLARFIYDKIIAYPTEDTRLQYCKINKSSMQTINYAIKEKKYNMLKQLLNDINCNNIRIHRKFIMILDNMLKNDNFECFAIITNYIAKNNLIIRILLHSSIFTHSLIDDLNLVKEHLLINWYWNAKNGRPFCIDDITIDFKDDSVAMPHSDMAMPQLYLSADMEEFVNEKFELICHFIDSNFEQFKYFNNVAQYINNLQSFDMGTLYHYNNKYLIIDLLNRRQNDSFMIIYILITYIKNFNTNYIYGEHGTILDMTINYILDNYTPALFNANEQLGRKIRFTNAMLIYRLLCRKLPQIAAN